MTFSGSLKLMVLLENMSAPHFDSFVFTNEYHKQFKHFDIDSFHFPKNPSPQQLIKLLFVAHTAQRKLNKLLNLRRVSRQRPIPIPMLRKLRFKYPHTRIFSDITVGYRVQRSFRQRLLLCNRIQRFLKLKTVNEIVPTPAPVPAPAPVPSHVPVHVHVHVPVHSPGFKVVRDFNTWHLLPKIQLRSFLSLSSQILWSTF